MFVKLSVQCVIQTLGTLIFVWAVNRYAVLARLVSKTKMANDSCPCPEPMGLGLIGSGDVQLKRKYQWLFKVRGIGNAPNNTVLALPPRRGNRPILGWKEYDFQHLNETIYYP